MIDPVNFQVFIYHIYNDNRNDCCSKTFDSKKCLNYNWKKLIITMRTIAVDFRKQLIVNEIGFILKQSREDSRGREDPLLLSLGFRTTTPSPSQSGDHLGLGSTTHVGQKRSGGEDGDMNVTVKRPMDSSHQVTSSGTSSSINPGSKLWEKNRMLASLLAIKPESTNVPPIPASVISATPQVVFLI